MERIVPVDEIEVVWQIRREGVRVVNDETGSETTLACDGIAGCCRVPADLIETGWDTQRILKEPNAEIRRCAIERMGWPAFITEARLKQVGATVDDPGNPGQTLALYDVPERIYDAPIRVLICTNATVERDGTRHTFGLTVPEHIATPLAAAAWTFDIPESEYAALDAAC